MQWPLELNFLKQSSEKLGCSEKVVDAAVVPIGCEPLTRLMPLFEC